MVTGYQGIISRNQILMKIFFSPPLLLLALSLLMTQTVWAQTGSVTYVHTLRMDVDLPPEMEQFAQYMPEAVTTTYEMGFTEVTSLTTKVTNELKMSKGAKQLVGDGVNVKFSFGGGGTDEGTAATYVNLDEGSFVEERTFLGRTFLITGDLPELAWKLSGEEGQILERHVFKATAMWDTSAVEAWFTPEIPAAMGPGQFGGLPGLILMLSVDQGQQLYEASEIDLSVIPEISAPEKGREVTQEEFDALVAEKREEMMQNASQTLRSVIIRGN